MRVPPHDANVNRVSKPTSVQREYERLVMRPTRRTHVKARNK